MPQVLISGLRTEVFMTTFKNSKMLKADARASLLGHLTTPVLSILLYLFATSMLTEMIANWGSGSVLLSLILFFVVNTVANMLRIGLACIFLRLQLQKSVLIGDLFYAFRNNSDTSVMYSAFLAMLELLCMLPAIIAVSVLSPQGRTAYAVLLLILFAAGLAGSFYARLRYALCPYLFLDFPSLSARALIKGGARMLDGHKGRLFKLYLSFLPLHILTILSLGVAGLWVSSYSHAAEAAFYRDFTLHLS